MVRTHAPSASNVHFFLSPYASWRTGSFEDAISVGSAGQRVLKISP